MTLVVAELNGQSLNQISDTQESDPNQTNRGSEHILPGILKTFIICPWLSLSFSGKSVWALDALNRVQRLTRKPPNITVVIGVLLSIHNKSEGDVDFLVCSLKPKPKLYKISEGQVMKGGKKYWIGSPDAASKFLELTEKDKVSWSDAFKNIIDSEEFASVGGLSIPSGTTNDGFNYLHKAMSFMPSQKVISGQAVRFGTAQEGGFAFSIICPKMAGQAIVGIHFYQGQFGYVYNPRMHEYPKLILGDYDSFCEEVHSATGVSVHGVMLN